MFNPPHPGEFISEVYLAELGICGRELAAASAHQRPLFTEFLTASVASLLRWP